MKISLTLNGEVIELDLPEDTPLLWVLRDTADLKGTKFGCGKAACGSCTVIVDGMAIRSCSYPAKLVEGKEVVTIEGLADGEALHPIQQAWIEEVVPQCGYCQPGFMMAATALLDKNPQPTDEDIDNQILNICRCGTYYRIRKAIHRAAEIQKLAVQDLNLEEGER